MQKRRLHIIRDTREQDGFTFKDGFDPAPIVTVSTLRIGDYSLKGYEPLGDFDETTQPETMHHRFAIERKSKQDFVGCIGKGRERFKRELYRAWKSCFRFAIVVECPLSELLAGHYIGSLNPACIVPTVDSIWIRYNIPTIFCNCKQDAASRAFGIMRLFLDQRDKEADARIKAREADLLNESDAALEATT